MANFPHALNTDSNMKLTNGIWDDNIAEWMIKVQNYVMSSGGIIWIPDSVDASGNKKVSVKDSVLPTGAATQTTLADILSKILTAPATEAKQDSMIAAIENSVVKIDPAQNNVQLSGSNVEQANGADIALKSALVAGKTSAGKGVPIQVDADGKLQVGGITVESLVATTVGIDQTTPGTTNKVVAELSGSTLAEQKTQADASDGNVTFSENIEYVEIYNTDANAGVFTVNGIALSVPSGVSFKAKIGGTPSSIISISTSVSYIISRYI